MTNSDQRSVAIAAESELQGSLIVNTASLIGMQLVVEEYPLRHPLIVPAAQ